MSGRVDNKQKNSLKVNSQEEDNLPLKGLDLTDPLLKRTKMQERSFGASKNLRTKPGGDAQPFKKKKMK